MTHQQFADSMAYLGIAFGKEYTQEELSVYYDFLKEFTDETLIKAIKKIISTSKFLPKITELVETCEQCKETMKFEILEYMNLQGYFQSSIEYDKASIWLERNIIPYWFKEDMKKYFKMKQQYQLDNKTTKMIGETYVSSIR